MKCELERMVDIFPVGRPPHGGRGLKYDIRDRFKSLNRRPPHGGRGLKFLLYCKELSLTVSPSSRRAWIEILSILYHTMPSMVALLTEGVD